VRFTAFSSTTFFAEQRRILRYLFVGGVAACVDIGLFLLFAGHLALPYLWVAAATFTLATLVNYILGIRFVFVSGRRFRRRWELVLVYLVSGVGLALNQAILALGVEVMGLGLLASKLVATCVVFFWNYASRRLIIFGPTRV
jgi:putative flippase GtrA